MLKLTNSLAVRTQRPLWVENNESNPEEVLLLVFRCSSTSSTHQTRINCRRQSTTNQTPIQPFSFFASILSVICEVKMNYLQSLVCCLYFYFDWSFLKSLPALQVDCSPFRGIGPENRACPSNQHKQSLKPLFQNPSWKGNESGKETGVTAAQRTHGLQSKEGFKLHRQKRTNQYMNRKHPISYFRFSCSRHHILPPPPSV